MTLTTTYTQNIVDLTQSISIYNPDIIDSVFYNSEIIIYPYSEVYSLSKSDFALWIAAKNLFYVSMFQNFPDVSRFFNQPLPTCEIKLYNPTSNVINFYQVSSDSNLIYNINYKKDTQVVLFDTRPAEIKITMQEYLIAYEFLSIFGRQVSLS